VEAALCERDRCGNVVIWQHTREGVESTPASDKKIWPYAIAASAAALAITGLVLWRAGVFDRAPPTSRETWVFNGQQQMGLRF
jgi:hypothetical protein